MIRIIKPSGYVYTSSRLVDFSEFRDLSEDEIARFLCSVVSRMGGGKKKVGGRQAGRPYFFGKQTIARVRNRLLYFSYIEKRNIYFLTFTAPRDSTKSAKDFLTAYKEVVKYMLRLGYLDCYYYVFEQGESGFHYHLHVLGCSKYFDEILFWVNSPKTQITRRRRFARWVEKFQTWYMELMEKKGFVMNFSAHPFDFKLVRRRDFSVYLTKYLMKFSSGVDYVPYYFSRNFPKLSYRVGYYKTGFRDLDFVEKIYLSDFESIDLVRDRRILRRIFLSMMEKDEISKIDNVNLRYKLKKLQL